MAWNTNLRWRLDILQIIGSCLDAFSILGLTTHKMNCSGIRIASRKTSTQHIVKKNLALPSRCGKPLKHICFFQVDNSDLVSLQGNEPGLDPETEQLITEIERLTSRALQETNQWTKIFGQPDSTVNPGTAGTSTTSGLVVGLTSVTTANTTTATALDNVDNKANNNGEIWTLAN